MSHFVRQNKPTTFFRNKYTPAYTIYQDEGEASNNNLQQRGKRKWGEARMGKGKDEQDSHKELLEIMVNAWFAKEQGLPIQGQICSIHPSARENLQNQKGDKEFSL